MREKELRACAKCGLCGKPFGASGMPLFYRIKIERFGVKGDVVRRQAGLEQMLGSVQLAQAMGPDEEMTMPLMEPLRMTVCETCSVQESHCIAAMVEIGERKEEAERGM